MGIYQQNPPGTGDPAVKSSSAWKQTDVARWILYVTFYALLANIPFWVASRWLAISQDGWFCLEYIAVGLLALFLPRIIAPLLLLLAVAIDLIGAISETYFLPISQIFTNLGAVRQLSASRLFAGAVVLLLTLLAATISALPPVATVPKKYRARVAGCFLAFAVLCLSIDSIEVLRSPGDRPGHIQAWHEIRGEIRVGYFPKLSLSRVPVFRLALRKLFPAPSGLPIRNAATLAMQSAESIAAQNKGEPPNLVLILVESWGIDTDSSVRNALVEPYAQPGLLARYDVLQGTVPFLGPTLGGEARELCGSTMGFRLMKASAQELQGCLPDRLAAMGYHNVAIHGMWGEMFDRVKWYKTIGFQDMWFTDKFHQEDLPNCDGAFWGICDAAIAEWMGRRLEQHTPTPEFLYWVTLNSHLPVRVPSPLTSPASCSFTPSLAQQPSLCSWYQLIANVHHSVADMAMTNLARPTVIAIVGDHAPPFSDPSLRDQFSQAVVPYVLLVPRHGATK
ncbi:sulfatase-like hydrolase/transferase [Acidicapsa acidisoli]|uniref:sulfatase-like hydrolase/transferase n=1 Tax=Acidicapsa acidisoli TaxID=1615681 RepID=UPI0021DFD771|nr:sulfatase-like hydrolase/transferase [Acidicapsa acidisoli]